MAVEFARAAERAGADGILVLPQYLLNVEQEGLHRHVEAVCNAVGIGVIVYNRDNAIFAPSTLERLAEKHPNMIGFKDGHGDVEQLVRVRQIMGDRLVYVGGMPTAEVFAVPYFAAGFTTYSSAVYNFVPEDGASVSTRRCAPATRATTDELLQKFFTPISRCATARRGYAVSIVKAGMRIVGSPAGPVRSPLTDLSDAETAELRKIMVGALGENFA